MNTLDELEYLSEYREDNRIEAKRAQGGLPHSLWETYSAFANTLGGVILLGVAEAADKSLYSVHLPSPETLAEGFWRAVNDPKIASVNLLRPEDVRVVKSGKNHIVVIFVPPAAPEVRPVYVGGDPYTGSYFRSGEGDCRMPPEQVEALLRAPAPAALPTNTVTPMDSPATTMVIRLNSWLPVATPDCSAVPAKRPTIRRSAAPYMACRNRASSTGTAKVKRDFRIFPWVRGRVFMVSTPLRKRGKQKSAGQERGDLTRHLIRRKTSPVFPALR